MATRQKILNGPGTADLLFEGLGHCKPLEFTFEDKVVGRKMVRIQMMGPEDGSGNRWLIRGTYPSALQMPIRFSGYYDSRTRKGWYELAI